MFSIFKKNRKPQAVKVYRQTIPAARFIGKKYGNEDRVDGYFGAKWNEWNDKGWFDLLGEQISGCHKSLYEDGDAAVGLMRHPGGDHSKFEYWIGYFTPAGTAVPDGFGHEDMPAMDIGAVWFYEKDEKKYDLAPEALARLEKDGFIATTDWNFERYSPARLSNPAINKRIIDICFFVE